MTHTYTDADVARYAASIINSKYSADQAGPLAVLVEKILLQKDVGSITIGVEADGDTRFNQIDLELRYIKPEMRPV